MTVQLFVHLFACGAAVPAPVASEPLPAPAAPASEPLPAPTAPAPDQAAPPGVLRVHALTLHPDTPAMRTAMEGVLSAWRTCASGPEPGCGFQVLYVEQDRHTNTYSMGWYVDALDGPVETCIGQNAESLTRSAETPIPHGYVAAIAVAPTEDALARCMSGLADQADPYF